MRDRETIDSELRELAAVRRSIREHGGQLSTRQIDELLDERLGHRPAAAENTASQTEVVSDTSSRFGKTDDSTPNGPKGVLRRFGRLAALPLSLVAAAAVFVVMFAVQATPSGGADRSPAIGCAAQPDGADRSPAVGCATQPGGAPSARSAA